MAEHPLSAIQRIDPKMMDHLKDMSELIYCSGALPRKVKLLRAMAFDPEIYQEIGLTERGRVPISIASPQDMTRPVTERSGLGVAGIGMGGWA